MSCGNGVMCRRDPNCSDKHCQAHQEQALYAPLRTQEPSIDTSYDDLMAWFADMAHAARLIVLWGALMFVGLLVAALI